MSARIQMQSVWCRGPTGAHTRGRRACLVLERSVRSGPGDSSILSHAHQSRVSPCAASPADSARSAQSPSPPRARPRALAYGLSDCPALTAKQPRKVEPRVERLVAECVEAPARRAVDRAMEVVADGVVLAELQVAGLHLCAARRQRHDES
eukprot:SAG31_NODE_569_length_14020_cov_11.049565_13_plen_151_part_00